MRFAAKRDENEPDIIAALIARGADPVQMSQKGIPDLSVLIWGETFWVEVKMPGKGLTEAQKATFGRFRKASVRVWIIHSATEADMFIEGRLQPWEP